MQNKIKFACLLACNNVIAQDKSNDLSIADHSRVKVVSQLDEVNTIIVVKYVGIGEMSISGIKPATISQSGYTFKVSKIIKSKNSIAEQIMIFFNKEKSVSFSKGRYYLIAADIPERQYGKTATLNNLIPNKNLFLIAK